MMQENRDIINEIIGKLKADTPRTYREGAWERFQQQHEPSKSVFINRSVLKWTSVAAAVALIGFATKYFIRTETNVEQLSVQQQNTMSNQLHTGELLSGDSFSSTNKAVSKDGVKLALTTSNKSTVREEAAKYLPAIAELSTSSLVLDNIQSNIPALVQLNEVKPSLSTFYSEENNGLTSPRNTEELATILSTKSMMLNNATSEVLATNHTKRVNLSDKINLALFVSPYATNDKLNIGGGMTVAYKVHPKISVRTGLSYNSYEVGVMKNPLDPEQVETVRVEDNMNIQKSEMAEVSLYANKMILPNINAIRGVVNTLEVPLEMQFHVNKSFYANAGASYSAIIHQTREAEYVEQVPTHSSSFTKSATIQTVKRSMKTSEPNVNTNGFSGFVNFSVGKKVQVNNRVGLAVEPYIKVPVGQYRRADMDYTNGGIRIMTNF